MYKHTDLPYITALMPYFDADTGAGNGAGASENVSDEEKVNGQGNEPKGESNTAKGKSDGQRTYTDEQLDEIIAKKLAKERAKHEKQLEEAKAEAEKLAKMNADQKKEYEIEQLKAENERLKASQVKAELSKEAAKLLSAEDIEATQDMLEFVVGKDAEATQANIDKFVKIIKDQVQAAEIKRNTGSTPQNYTNTGKGLTAEEIMKEPDRAKRQRLINENMDLFKRQV